MNYKEYLYQNYSSKLVDEVVKKAQREGRISPNKALRYKTIVPLEAAYWGLGGGMLGSAEINRISGSVSTNIPGAILGTAAGLGIGTGIGVGLNKIIDSHGRNTARKKIKNALDSGMITEKELKNYVKTGKVTPGIISAISMK